MYCLVNVQGFQNPPPERLDSTYSTMMASINLVSGAHKKTIQVVIHRKGLAIQLSTLNTEAGWLLSLSQSIASYLRDCAVKLQDSLVRGWRIMFCAYCVQPLPSAPCVDSWAVVALIGYTLNLSRTAAVHYTHWVLLFKTVQLTTVVYTHTHTHTHACTHTVQL